MGRPKSRECHIEPTLHIYPVAPGVAHESRRTAVIEFLDLCFLVLPWRFAFGLRFNEYATGQGCGEENVWLTVHARTHDLERFTVLSEGP